MDTNEFIRTPSRDVSRQDATGLDTDYTLSLDEAGELYARAGHPRTLRSLQRYCVTGHLEARKIATAIGDKYLVTRQSVNRHIAEIQEMSALDNVATLRDLSRHVATPYVSEKPLESAPDTATVAATESVIARQAATAAAPEVSETQPAPSEPATVSTPHATPAADTVRQAATEPAPAGESPRYVATLEHQLEVARDERDFLREQINRKDKTIDALIERDRETNYLVRGLQEMLTPLLSLGARRPDPPAHQ